jgi:manganese oxidase
MGAAVTRTSKVAAMKREYFISADEVRWNFAPDGVNDITGEPFDDKAKTYVEPGDRAIGATHTMCLYRGYTDKSFTTASPARAGDGPLGILGPVIRAQVGDTLEVHFRNTCAFAASIHPHGVFYAKNAEGAAYADGTSGAAKDDDAVPTGGTFTYSWKVPDRAGPAAMDVSSVMWMYHSHVDEIKDTNSGLMGPMVITAKGKARADGSPVDVDQEEFALYSVINQNESQYLDKDREPLPKPPADKPFDADDEESNLMHTINGYVYGNGPMFTMKAGQNVRWYLMSMGTEVDLHTPHWHGNTVVANGMRMDTVGLMPATMITADMTPDNPGIWLFHCHVNDHIAAGMISRYQVTA